jgi:hypothetical protein
MLLVQPVRFTVTATVGTDASVALGVDPGDGTGTVVLAGAASDQPRIDSVAALAASATYLVAVRDVPTITIPFAGGTGTAPVWRGAGLAAALTLLLWVVWLWIRRRRRREALL